MPIIVIESPDDPRIAPYRNLKDKELARDGGRFIAEGEQLVRRLLKSRIPADSLLLAQRKCAAIAPLAPDDLPVYIADDDLIGQILGFEFHSGVIGCGLRPAALPLSEAVGSERGPAVILVCQEITNSENLGGLIRISAALGARAMVLGERCSDPFFRQCIRVSMGAIFSLPMVRSGNLIDDLDWLSRERGFVRIAAVLDEPAQSLQSLAPPQRAALVLGSEAQGLDAATISHCDQKVTIPMKLGTDSLNVAVAAAVFLYHLTGFEQR